MCVCVCASMCTHQSVLSSGFILDTILLCVCVCSWLINISWSLRTDSIKMQRWLGIVVSGEKFIRICELLLISVFWLLQMPKNWYLFLKIIMWNSHGNNFITLSYLFQEIQVKYKNINLYCLWRRYCDKSNVSKMIWVFSYRRYHIEQFTKLE